MDFFIFKKDGTFYSMKDKNSLDEYVGGFYLQQSSYRLERYFEGVKICVKREDGFVFFFISYNDEDNVFRKRILNCLKVEEIPKFPSFPSKRELKEYFTKIIEIAQQSQVSIGTEYWEEKSSIELFSKKQIMALLSIFDI